ncbi:hypothetical protein KA005_74155 [bacterium]|nr:hypothetical protein [bacterium]
MGWFSKLKGKFSKQQEPQFRPVGPPDAKFLGDFLVYQFLGDRFGLQEQQLEGFVAEVPNELRELTKLWILFYLSWLFKLYAASKYGNEFAEDLQAQIKERFEKAESIEDKMKGIGQTFEFWMERLDDSTSHADTKVKGMEVPFEVFAAMAFLALDASSPFYKSTDTNNVEFDVGIAFASAKDEAMALIQNSVDLGGPVEEITG